MAKEKCDCRAKVNNRVDGGELSGALSRSHFITDRARESMTDQALQRKSLRGRFVDDGEVRAALSRAGWSSNEIDFALYRSLHEHEE